MNFIRKYSACKEKGSSTIEASLVFIIFVIGYLVIYSLSIDLLVESITRKALFETGMEISNYMQFAETIDVLDDVKTKDINSDDYKKLIIKHVNGQAENNILEEMTRLLIDDLSYEVKNEGYKSIAKNIFNKKMNTIKSNVNFENLGIINGLEGINIDNIEILDDSNNIKLSIKYSFNLDRFGMFAYKNDILQTVNFASWVRGIGDKVSKDGQEKSIWDESNFVRGRYFAERMREKHPDILIRKGSGVDLFDSENNTIIQVYSLKIFNKTYSDLSDGEITIKEEFYQQIKSYYKKLLINIENLGNEFISSDGKKIPINNPKEKLIIILPEEAKDLDEIRSLVSKMGNVEFQFIEKAKNVN